MIRTKRLYFFDTMHLGHLAKISAIDTENNAIQLDATIFHPQGGGQPSDTGNIDGHEILKVFESPSGEILHKFNSMPEFTVGQSVVLQVEPRSRMCFSRLHSAGHLIAHVAEDLNSDLKAIQGHHFPNEARVEFSCNEDIDVPNFVDELSRNLTKEIHKNAEVVSEYDDRHGRTITMGDFPKTPCGGTHVTFLSEIGKISIRSAKQKNGRLRIGYNV